MNIALTLVTCIGQHAPDNGLTMAVYNNSAWSGTPLSSEQVPSTLFHLPVLLNNSPSRGLRCALRNYFRGFERNSGRSHLNLDMLRVHSYENVQRLAWYCATIVFGVGVIYYIVFSFFDDDVGALWRARLATLPLATSLLNSTHMCRPLRRKFGFTLDC